MDAEALKIPTERFSLIGLRSATALLDHDHPLRVVVAQLPEEMANSDFAAVAPTLWALAGRG